jgi:hypothetical protein
MTSRKSGFISTLGFPLLHAEFPGQSDAFGGGEAFQKGALRLGDFVGCPAQRDGDVAAFRHPDDLITEG